MTSAPVIIKKEVTINKPVDVLWTLIEPAENICKWFPMADKSELLSGQGKGRMQKIFSKWGNKHAQIEQEVVEYEPKRLIRWKHIKELLDGKPAPNISKETYFSISLSPIDKGTIVTLQSENYPDNFFKGLLLRLIAKRRIDEALEKSLKILSN